MNTNTAYNLIIILGPTASGKTGFAARLAHKLNTEIISADSRQIYRRMNLGTGKDYGDYIVEDTKIPCHLIDIRDPGYKYNVFEYQKDFLEIYSALRTQNKVPVLCGGTGMYIEAVIRGYKLISVPLNNALRTKLQNKSMDELTEILSGYKKLHNRTDSDTRKRVLRAIEIEEYYRDHAVEEEGFPEIKPLCLGVKFERKAQRERITTRLVQRLDEGMIQEVEALLAADISANDLIYYGLEYKFITLYLTGKMSYDEMVQKLNTAIHQFAKRQMTWFRKMERSGCTIHWLDGSISNEEKLEVALRYVYPHAAGL